ncbi:MAG: hypothetical protein WC899_06705 [bacterium]|jgi:hypothetical protein
MHSRKISVDGEGIPSGRIGCRPVNGKRLEGDLIVYEFPDMIRHYAKVRPFPQVDPLRNYSRLYFASPVLHRWWSVEGRYYQQKEKPEREPLKNKCEEAEKY